MATLESSSSHTLVHSIACGLTATSMQRTRGLARGQPSTDLTQQDTTSGGGGRNNTARGGGGRNNSKLKVLVRSHAMREETSPPREPTPTPCINLIPSTSVSPARSASPMYNHHTTPTSLHSPTSPRVVLSPRCSPTTNSTAATAAATVGGSPNHSAASPTVDGCTAVQPGRSKQHANNTVTVRTQDILNSAISRKINGSSASSSFAQIAVELNAAVNDEDFDDDDGTTMMEFSEVYSGVASVNTSTACDNNALNSSLNQKPPAQTVTNNSNSGRSQDYIVCDCYKPSCTRCTKNNNNNNNNINAQQQQQQQQPHSNNTLTVARANSGKHKLRHQSSSQCSFDGSSSTSPCLSRDNSTEQYTDTTGIDLTQFILETLNKNAKDRVMMLKIEQELVSLAKDKVKTHFKFPPMSSYQRMLVHRCAAYFGMDHNIEISGKCVVVNKTKSTRIPELRFRDHIREDLLFPEEPRRSILKRDSNSFEDCNYKSPDRQFDNRRSKSFEEREEEYEKARRRIFKDGTMQLQECNSQEDFNWAEIPWPESECSKIRLLPPEQQNVKQNRLQKVQSVDGKGESTLRPCVAKSFSFGGYGGTVSVLNRGDSVTSTHSAGPRLLTKQDSSTSTISWRLSPSSSGYKSQSQRSDSVTPSPTATPHQLSSDASAKNSLDGAEQQQQQQSITEETMEQAQQTDSEAPGAEGNPLVWAVTDMQSVPKGSVLINPQTGQPFTNHDGTIYHFDPSNPPPGFAATPSAPAANPAAKPPPSPPKTITPQRSPVKERSPSPKKPTKSTKVSPFKNKSCLINSSTSPSLPMTPPANGNSSTNSSLGYATSTPLENPQQTTHANLQQYHHQATMYPNGYGAAPSDAGGVPLYQQPLGMVYTPYAMPPPSYENRPDASVTDLSHYFVNMALSEPPPCATQTVGYQTPSGTYWNQQPTTITYYQQPPTNPSQPPPRYPVQVPLPSQSQNTFVSSNYAPNYGPVAANPAPSSDLLPVYPNAPVQMVYPGQQNPTPSPMYIQNQMLYAQNPSVYQQYPTLANATPSNATYTPPNYAVGPSQCFPPQTPNFLHNIATGYDHHRALHRNTPKNKCAGPKQASFSSAQPPPGSNQSSNGSNSPANTIITGYFPTNANAAMNYRQCTPPDTPPNQQGLGYGYPQNYMPHSVIFRPLSGIRASPPVNMRSSRSPTPAPEYPQVGSVDRNQRYPVGPTVYHSMPCIVPGDMRLMTGRAQPPVYRQPYRQQSSCQSPSDSASAVGRAHKARKPRTKVPALPPSGRQSNQQPVHAHTPQQRF